MENLENKKDKRGLMIVNKKLCKTCIFKDNQKVIRPDRLAEIKKYLVQGQNHYCHNTPYLCRGGREFQANIFNSLGIIKEPTIASLEESILKFENKTN